MSKILLSIKPEYVKRILDGTKKFEYRKRMPRKKVNLIYIYATAPIMKVVGFVEVVGVLSANKALLWNKTKNKSGISKEKYDEYFRNLEIGCAYKLGDVTIFDSQRTLGQFNIKHAPQSFVYLDNEHNI